MADLPLTMPKMSMTMEEGTMVAWLKSEGDAVKSGEPVCEVATDKVDMEVESPFDGILARITAQIDDVVKVGDPIGYITTDADDLLGGLFDEPGAPTSSDGAGAAGSGAPAGGATESSAITGSDSVGSDWPAAVPLARALAAEQGLDLKAISPSGPWGSIRVSDVVAPGASAPTVPAPTVPAAPVTLESALAPGPAAITSPPAGDPAESRRRRTRLQVAKVMTASAAVPQFTAYVDLDLETLSQVRKTDLGGASWTAILVKAQAIALRLHPNLNGVWSDGGVVLGDDIGVALAVDSPSGLMAPVLRNPDTMGLAELTEEIGRLVEDVRTGSIAMEQLSGGTTVFSNLGGFGVDSFNALLTPPHATALSAGAVRKKVVVLDSGAFGPRLTCTVGITVDHRVADGADAARFLATLKETVADSEKLLSH